MAHDKDEGIRPGTTAETLGKLETLVSMGNAAGSMCVFGRGGGGLAHRGLSVHFGLTPLSLSLPTYCSNLHMFNVFLFFSAVPVAVPPPQACAQPSPRCPTASSPPETQARSAPPPPPCPPPCPRGAPLCPLPRCPTAPRARLAAWPPWAPWTDTCTCRAPSKLRA